MTGIELSRRDLFVLSAAGAATVALPFPAFASGTHHGLSLFGELRYPENFTHFEYVNPNAPKGGKISFQPPNWGYNQNTQTFNTLNSFVLKGDAPPRMELCFDVLMVRAYDEPDAVYGHLAHSVTVDETRNVFTFHLRPEARFHDGSPVTAEDVAFSLMLAKEKGHPLLSQQVSELVSAEAAAPSDVRVTFSGSQDQEAVLFLAANCPVFSKTYYTENEFDAASLEMPLASGPYRVGNMEPGRFIEYERVKDYWGANLPTAVGHSNFDVIRIEFYRERQAAFEAFKKGDITWRQEFTSKTWATEYNFPAVEDGRVIASNTLFAAEQVPAFQGSFINMRRPKFSDPRTREAVALCFDFEWANENLFFGSYARTHSFFQNSDLMATGKPEGTELALLEPFRDRLPAEVFDDVYVPPVSDGSGRDRTILGRANRLLQEAGWKNEGGSLKNSEGETLSVEILIRSPIFERVYGNFLENLKRLGIEGSIRLVDPTQFQARMDAFDFDVIGIAARFKASPIAGLSLYFGSDSADQNGSRNLGGIANPAIDALIEKAGKVKSRGELVPILRAIDRIARSLHPWIPNWNSASHRVAFWDIFGWPEKKPDYWFPVTTTWWYDAEKAKAAGLEG